VVKNIRHTHDDSNLDKPLIDNKFQILTPIKKQESVNTIMNKQKNLERKKKIA